MTNDNLGDRMKEFYENIPKTKLMRRCPVIVRLDMKSGHSFTRGFHRPFDKIFGDTMTRTMEYLCKNVQGCVFGYKESDEISLVLTDYKKFSSDAFFDYEVMKVCSITASMATMAFNRYFDEAFEDWIIANRMEPRGYGWNDDELVKRFKAYDAAQEKGAMFDARCFNIPKEEVVNCIYWRQLDAARNSVQMAARAKFSHSKCDHKSQSQLQEMLFHEHGINWNNYETQWKRGVCWTREKGIDYEMPMLKGEDREYLEKLVYYREEN